MKKISLELQDNIFEDTENVLKSVNVPLDRYIIEAILYYNQQHKIRQMEKELEAERKQNEGESETPPKNLSKFGEWRRKHPHGFGDVIINDPSILYGI
ncbi:MAG: hypothetical protein LBF08_00920 [Dysgonamonadaceae bacterium]|jgi:hypothetical protein|nr:hypothetical protein [Dysgonamonadaceae bacterium]